MFNPLSRLSTLWRANTQRPRMESEMDAELRFHLQAYADDLIRSGVPPVEAARRARLEFGAFDSTKDECRRALGFRLMDELRQDLRYAARSLRKSPVFAAAVIVALALGIGANTAIFGMIDEALLRPLPLPAPGQLTAVYNFNKKTGAYLSSSYPDYQDFSRRAQSFQQLSAYVRVQFNVMIGDHAERIPMEAVTANYFQMLQLPPLMGRAFREEDERGAIPAIMLAEDFWRGRFQGDPTIIGKSLVIEDQSFTIVGIVPRRYRGANLAWADMPDMWIPISTVPAVMPRIKAIGLLHQRAGRWLLMLGRLRPEATVDQSQAELQALAARLAEANPTDNRDVTVLSFPAGNAKFWPAYRASISQWFAVFGGAAALVLLLACANVANLLLERAAARRREIAVRLSIGASRFRLLRQLLTENVLLVVPSFGLALMVAFGLQKLLAQFPSALGFVLTLHAGLEWRVLLLCAALSLVTTVLFGLAPAWQAVRPDVLPALKESGNAISGFGRDWVRNALVAAQIGFCAILLIGGGLFGRTLLKAYAADLGFRSGHMLTLAFNLPAGKVMGGQPEGGSIYALLQRIAALPGVEAASVATRTPLSRFHAVALVTDSADPAAAPLSVEMNFVGPDYLRTAGIPLAMGRDFTPRDAAVPANAAIVNRTLAERFWHGANPVGHAILVREGAGKMAAHEIVGVARDSKYGSVWEQREPYLYLLGPAENLIVRTRTAPEALIPELRRAWDEIAPLAPIYEIQTGDQLLAKSLAPQRFAAAILGAFGSLAILLASIGLYGVMAYAVARRTREIGIRIAIGAAPGAVVRQVLRKALALAAIGLLSGAAVSAGLTRFIASQVKDVSPYDAVTFAAVAALLTGVSLIAALVPAMRAARDRSIGGAEV